MKQFYKMNISKYICILCTFALLPLFAKAQNTKPVTERQAKQIGKDIYVTSSGDTTLIVNAISKGLKTKDTQFLFRKKGDPEMDSIFSNRGANYSSLETATLDISRLLQEMELEKEKSKGNNDALSFRLSSKNRDIRKKELEAREISDEIVKKEHSVQELADLYAVFGDKPTYYINGLEVPQTVINQLYPDEIISKTMRVNDTASGNPNGEVWYMISEKGLNRIKLPISVAHNNNPEITVYTGVPKSLSSYIEEVKKVERERNRAALKSQPVVKREVTPDGKLIDKVVDRTEKPTSTQETKASEYGTRVISRTINNQKVDTNEELPSLPATPRKSIPTVKRVYNDTKNTKESTASPVSEEKDSRKAEGSVEDKNDQPKKSVRRIKARHENKDEAETKQN